MSLRVAVWCVVLSACDTGKLKPGECLPPAAGNQQCAPLTFFNQCLPTEAAERRDLCALATVRPEIVSSFSCREGIDWRLALPGSPETCSYAGGVLVGATFETPNQAPSIGGRWVLHDCVPAQLCPDWDGGTCTPRGNANRPCDEDESHFGFCKPSEAEQRTTLCADAGSHSRTVATCDGGVILSDVHSSIGPTDTCVYSDGGLIGAGTVSDTNTGAVHGVWSLADCVQVVLCP